MRISKNEKYSVISALFMAFLLSAGPARAWTSNPDDWLPLAEEPSVRTRLEAASPHSIRIIALGSRSEDHAQTIVAFQVPGTNMGELIADVWTYKDGYVATFYAGCVSPAGCTKYSEEQHWPGHDFVAPDYSIFEMFGMSSEVRERVFLANSRLWDNELFLSAISDHHAELLRNEDDDDDEDGDGDVDEDDAKARKQRACKRICAITATVVGFTVGTVVGGGCLYLTSGLDGGACGAAAGAAGGISGTLLGVKCSEQCDKIGKMPPTTVRTGS